MPEEQDENRGRDGQGRFVKGVSGNHGGRPRGSINLSSRIKGVLSQEQGGKEVADILAEVLVREALRNPARLWPFLKEFMDRDEGRTDRRGEEGMTESAEATAAAVRGAVEAMRKSVPEEK